MANRPIGRVGQAGSPQEWFSSLPLVTKVICTGTFLCSALVTFEVLSPATLAFIPDRIISKFEIWRIFSPYLYIGKFSFPCLMHLMALYENTQRYEHMPFNTGAGGTSADFVWMLCLAAVIFPIIAFFMREFFFGECILFMIMYVWSRREPEGTLNIFGFKFQALYLPWVYLAIRLVMGNSIIQPLEGIVVGHLYYFLAEVLPLSHNIDMIKTPGFVIRLVDRLTGVTAVPTAVNTGRQPTQMGYTWGGGRRLGVQ